VKVFCSARGWRVGLKATGKTILAIADAALADATAAVGLGADTARFVP